MRRELTITGLIAAGIYLWGCQPGADPEVKKKLDEISTKLDDLSKKVGAGGAGMQRPQPPQGPDPNTVYAVPIEGAAFKGPQNAKVTIVEAFEYA